MRAREAAASLLLAALLLGGCATARRLDPRTAEFPLPAFEPPHPGEIRLSRGAPAYLLEDRDVPLIRLYLGFKGGALYDPADKAGLASVAALAWRTGGVEGFGPEAFDEAVEGRGMNLALALGRDTGWISLSVLPVDLERGLDLLARLVLRPSFDGERFAWAKTRVADRVRRQVDDPQTLAFQELRKALYRGHPRGVEATVETIERVDLEDVVGLHRRLVEDGVWKLGVVGDFDSEPLGALLEDYFGGLPGEGHGFPPLPPPPVPEPRLVLVPRNLPQSTIVWARLGPERTSREFYPLEVADYVLGSGGFQSRLVREIRSDRGLAYSVGSFYEALPTFGVLGTQAQTQTEATEQVVQLMDQVLGEAAEDGLGQDEVDRAREALVNRHVFRYEDSATPVQDQILLSLQGLPPDLPSLYPGGIAAVDPADVASVIRKFYALRNGVTVIVGNADTREVSRRMGVPVEIVEVP